MSHTECGSAGSTNAQQRNKLIWHFSQRNSELHANDATIIAGQALERRGLLLSWRFINLVIIIVSFCIIAYLQGIRVEKQYVLLLAITFLSSLLLFDEAKWEEDLKLTFPRSVRTIVARWFLVCGFLALLGFSSKMYEAFSHKAVLTWMAVTPLTLVFFHILLARVQYRNLTNSSIRRAVIVGKQEISRKLVHTLKSERHLGIKCVACFDDRNQKRLGKTVLPLRGKIRDVGEFVRTECIQIIYIALPMTAAPRIMALLDDLHDTTASIYFIPDIFAFDLIQARLGQIRGIPAVAICESPLTGPGGVMKRVVDFWLSLAILVLVSPLMLLIALGIKLSSPGPVIFKQHRYGLNGEKIVVYKFRTMTVCEDGYCIAQAKECDYRVTRFGAFLRKTSLDELPQFINVLQGRMSIVGPRPHAVAHNELYRKKIKGYMVRHKVRPGITGLAQVNGCRGETKSINMMEQRIKYDLEYLRHWSLSLDFSIILRTIPVVLWPQKNAY